MVCFCKNCKFALSNGFALPTGEKFYCEKQSYWVMEDDVCKKHTPLLSGFQEVE